MTKKLLASHPQLLKGPADTMKHPLAVVSLLGTQSVWRICPGEKKQCCVEKILIISHFTWFVRIYKTSKSDKIEDIKIFDDYTLSFELENQLFIQLTTSWNIVGSRRTPYHPEGDWSKTPLLMVNILPEIVETCVLLNKPACKMQLQKMWASEFLLPIPEGPTTSDSE